jgi:hypothetical protein
MEICTDDQQCSEILNVSTSRLHNPEKLRIDTGSEIKSYRMTPTSGKLEVPKHDVGKKKGAYSVPETAGKLRKPKSDGVSPTKRDNKIGLKAYFFAIDSGATCHKMNVIEPLSKVVYQSNSS